GAKAPTASAATAAQTPALTANLTTVHAFLYMDRLIQTAGASRRKRLPASGRTRMRPQGRPKCTATTAGSCESRSDPGGNGATVPWPSPIRVVATHPLVWMRYTRIEG